jgi:hypothetical protein
MIGSRYQRITEAIMTSVTARHRTSTDPGVYFKLLGYGLVCLAIVLVVIGLTPAATRADTLVTSGLGFGSVLLGFASLRFA